MRFTQTSRARAGAKSCRGLRRRTVATTAIVKGKIQAYSQGGACGLGHCVKLPLAKTGRHWQKGVERMKKLLCLGLVLIGWNYSARAQDKAAAPAATVFQIGVADGDYREFALAGDYQAYQR